MFAQNAVWGTHTQDEPTLAHSMDANPGREGEREKGGGRGHLIKR